MKACESTCSSSPGTDQEISSKFNISSGEFVPTNFKDIETEAKHKSCVVMDSSSASEGMTMDETCDTSSSKFGFNSDLTSQAHVFDASESRATISRKDSMSMIGDIDSEFEISLPTKEAGMNAKAAKPFVPTATPAPFFKPESAPSTENSGISAGLDKLKINDDFTPSTPYVHKFRTELCKNWELYGKCKYGDECSFAHGKRHMMVKTDVSVLYKTKLCKKFSQNGYCPYGMRCQFVHDISELKQTPEEKQVEMCVHSTNFEPSSKQKSGEVSVQAASNTGGFGNKQTKTALETPNVIYRDILVHDVHVSVQEYQKKMKMYQKKVTKRRQQELISPPELQYQNIYKASVKRLGVFQDITAQSKGPVDDYFHGDATSYENHLNVQLK